jgi:hypothetical protein
MEAHNKGNARRGRKILMSTALTPFSGTPWLVTRGLSTPIRCSSFDKSLALGITGETV